MPLNTFTYRSQGFKTVSPKKSFSKAVKRLARKEGISRELARELVWEVWSHQTPKQGQLINPSFKVVG